MLVRKVDPDWFPSENKTIAVGETIEITDPKSLILAGKVKAVGAMGEDITAFELYGAVTPSEMEDYKAFMDQKKQESINEALQKEKTALEEKKAQLDAEVKSTPELTAEEKARAEKVRKELSK